MPLDPGTRLGPHQLIAKIGEGGMGEVYRATDTRLGRTVAVKVLSQHFAPASDLKHRFEREARAIATLNHPHICVLHDIGHANGIDYLVMEYVEGETLAVRLAALRAHASGSGRQGLPFGDMMRYAAEIADALGAAHRHGIVHRDLKPANVMLTKTGVKLLDFGIAKLHEPPAATDPDQTPTKSVALTGPHTVLGTLRTWRPSSSEARKSTREPTFLPSALLFTKWLLAPRRLTVRAARASRPPFWNLTRCVDAPAACACGLRSRNQEVPGEGPGRAVADGARSRERASLDRGGGESSRVGASDQANPPRGRGAGPRSRRARDGRPRVAESLAIGGGASPGQCAIHHTAAAWGGFSDWVRSSVHFGYLTQWGTDCLCRPTLRWRSALPEAPSGFGADTTGWHRRSHRPLLFAGRSMDRLRFRRRAEEDAGGWRASGHRASTQSARRELGARRHDCLCS